MAEIREKLDAAVAEFLLIERPWSAETLAQLRSKLRRTLVISKYEPDRVDDVIRVMLERADETAGDGLVHGAAVAEPELPSDTVVPSEGSYRVAHQAPRPGDGYSRPVSELREAFGDPDVLEHPEWRSTPLDAEGLRQLKLVLANPDAEIIVYRAAPPTITAIGDDDWVTLSRAYAEEHAIQEAGVPDWPVIAMRVSAKQVFTDGNDLNEFGFSAGS
jgi:hypothetical protein